MRQKRLIYLSLVRQKYLMKAKQISRRLPLVADFILLILIDFYDFADVFYVL